MTDAHAMDGVIPIHECEPRSAMARAYALVFTMYAGSAWHHQLLLRDGEAPAVAIVFCPFCGVRLEREHFR